MNGGHLQPTSAPPEDLLPVLRKRVELLEDEVALLRRKLMSARRELAFLQGSDQQLALEALLCELRALEAKRVEQELALVEAEEQSSPQPSEDSKPPRRGHGPKPQPQLPVVEQIHELDPAQRQCKVCGGDLVSMGEQFESFEEVTVLERQYVLTVHKRRKYRCRCNSCVETAPSPLRLIPGGRYSLDFAIHVAENKYLDHLPLERQSRLMERRGLEVGSQTLWNQIEALASVAEPTYRALGQRVLEAPVLHADETRWPRLDGSGLSPWTIWTRSTPEIAHYTILGSKSAKVARRLFKGFEGIAVVDGFAVYEVLARDGPGFRLANCWAHVLRKFRDLEGNFPRASHQILHLIGKLYEIESLVPGPFPGDESAQRLRLTLREEKSQAILKEIRAWAETTAGLPRSELGKAVRYLLKRWSALTVFVTNPLVPLDNNAAERALRGPVVGRKNHYGSKSKRGTQVAAIFYTLLETAKLRGLDPALYLKTVAHRALEQPGTVTLPENLG